MVLDAGTGIRTLGRELGDEYKRRPVKPLIHLLLSHTHWDHIQGLPFFDLVYMEGVRLVISGSPGKRGLLEKILRGQMENEYFPVQMHSLSAELTIREMDQTQLQIGPFTIDWEEQGYHPGGSVRYRISLGDKKVVYASDVELNQCFADEPTPEQQAEQQKYMNFVQGADLLIGDGQYTEEEYPKVKGFGHTSIPLLVDIAYRAGVKQLAVFHHNPLNTDSVLDELWGEYHPKYMSMSPPMNVFWAREGQALPL